MLDCPKPCDEFWAQDWAQPKHCDYFVCHGPEGTSKGKSVIVRPFLLKLVNLVMHYWLLGTDQYLFRVCLFVSPAKIGSTVGISAVSPTYLAFPQIAQYWELYETTRTWQETRRRPLGRQQSAKHQACLPPGWELNGQNLGEVTALELWSLLKACDMQVVNCG